MGKSTEDRRIPKGLLEACLVAYVTAGTLDLSLDQMGVQVGISKRMLIHYFLSREDLEIAAINLLEERLRAQLGPSSFPVGTSPEEFVLTLWSRSTAPEARGVLQLIMDVTQRGWSGSERARAFYLKQQKMWQDLLAPHFPNPETVEELLQHFQGAILVYLVTGDADAGNRALGRSARRASTLEAPSRRE